MLSVDTAAGGLRAGHGISTIQNCNERREGRDEREERERVQTEERGEERRGDGGGLMWKCRALELQYSLGQGQSFFGINHASRFWTTVMDKLSVAVIKHPLHGKVDTTIQIGASCLS